MAEMPRGFLGDTKGSHHLIRRQAFLGFDHQQDGHEPFRQCQMRIVEHSSGGDGEPVLTVSAGVLFPRGDSRDALGAAPEAADTIGPAQALQEGATLGVSVEVHHERRQVHFSSRHQQSPEVGSATT